MENQNGQFFYDFLFTFNQQSVKHLFNLKKKLN